MFKPQFEDDPTPSDDTDPQSPWKSRPIRPNAMMAPVIVVGAILVFVLWDTTEKG